ncbi:uncharacterized protein LOC129218603 [Uloborus diversus]|uniref:uncharacterized protein LOC129218603 n=1 Tax=Uloborus diversus TaxID=327109 RepID=UPI0024091CD3|nr:uncharacterized protein LOC129218603 [Uloborus diversus]
MESAMSSVSAHDVCVTCVIPWPMSDDSFVSGSKDGHLKVWDRDPDGSYKENPHYRVECPEQVLSLSWLPGGKCFPFGLIIAGSSSGNIYRVDLRCPYRLFQLTGHSAPVRCLAPGGSLGGFISGSMDMSAKIWLSEHCLFTLRGHKDEVSAVALLRKDFVLTGSADCTIRLWNSDKCENIFEGHRSTVTALLPNSEGDFLSCSYDGTVRIWSLTGECLTVYDSHSLICDIVFLQNKEDIAVLCNEKIDIIRKFVLFQRITTLYHPLSFACSGRGTISVGNCDGGLHFYRIPEETNILHFSNLVEENEEEKGIHSHSNNCPISSRKESERIVELVPSMKEVFKKTIAIVGAGIAGLSCASRLKELGFLNVKVFEGTDRLGGRILTQKCGPDYVDLGAQWIHGERKNSVYEFALKEDLILKEAPDYMNHLYSFINLQNESQYVMVRQLLLFLEEKLDKIDEQSYYDASIFSYLHFHFTVWTSLNFHDESTEFLKPVFNWFVNFICEREGCRNLSDVSRSLYKRYKECDGRQTVEVKNGCYSIIKSILKNIPEEWVIPNHTVEAIDYVDFIPYDAKHETPEVLYDCLHSALKAKIKFKEGETVVCDHLILTVSVGCLKAKKIAFNPELENSKQAIIDSIGFDVVNKICLEFEAPFWNDLSIFNVLWEEAYEEIIEKSKPKEWKWKICWPKYINRFAYSIGNTKMLTAWIVGEGAEYTEELNNEEIIFGCMKLLELILHRDIPTPCQMWRSTWKTNPYFCGSYSYLTIANEDQKAFNSDLAKPILSNHVFCQQHPVIQFAGEATHSSFFSTMHGAYETGIREADRLVDHYMKGCDLLLKSNKALQNINIKMPRNYLKVVVIGAGLAGLTCGLHLLQKDFADVLILEAQNVVGGRVSTMNYGNSVLELGASWLHGSSNLLYKFSHDNNLLCNPSDFPSHEGEGVFCTSNGDIVDATIVEEIKEILNNIKNELGINNLNSKDLKSVMDVFSSYFSSYISNCNHCSNSDVKWALFHWFIKFETIDNGCDSLNEVAIQSYTDWQDCCEEMYHINYKTGFQSVIDSLCAQIPSNCIKVNMPVNTVKWNDKFIFREKKFFETEIDREFPILLQCEDGECISADSVIITASIGFLKDNMDKFFNPVLPLKKLQSIQRLGYGTINKIYLVFAEPFWNDDSCGFQLIWLDSMHNDCRKLLNENPWINGITGFDVVRNQPNVLLGWIGGMEAKQIENIDDITVKEVCTKILRIFLNKKDIPFPKVIFRTYWYTNPYIRGAYSFRSKEFSQFGHSTEDFSPLCCTYVSEKENEIEWPIMIFSGEAFDQSAFSSAHGAFQSGLKAFQFLDDACSKIERDLVQTCCNR